MINYNFTFHDAPNLAFLYFEWMYIMMSILVKEAGKITEHGKQLYQWDCREGLFTLLTICQKMELKTRPCPVNAILITTSLSDKST